MAKLTEPAPIRYVEARQLTAVGNPMDVMAVKEWRELYEALPPDQRQEFDRINQQADELAAQSRVERRRHEAICDAMQEAIDRIAAPTTLESPSLPS